MQKRVRGGVGKRVDVAIASSPLHSEQRPPRPGGAIDDGRGAVRSAQDRDGSILGASPAKIVHAAASLRGASRVHTENAFAKRTTPCGRYAPKRSATRVVQQFRKVLLLPTQAPFVAGAVRFVDISEYRSLSPLNRK